MGVVMWNGLEETRSHCHVHHKNWTGEDEEEWKVSLGKLFNGSCGSITFLYPEHLDNSASFPSPHEFSVSALWCQAPPGLPLAEEISCWPIKTDGRGPSLFWEYIYREARRLVGLSCYNMAEVTEEPQEPSSDSEIETRSLTQESPSVKGRNWKISCDLDDHEKEKVRLPSSYASSSSPTQSFPLAGPKPLLSPHLFSPSPPSHPLSQHQCLSVSSCFPTRLGK